MIYETAKEQEETRTHMGDAPQNLTAHEIQTIHRLQAENVPVAEIARRFGTSREIVEYLTPPLPEGYNMRIIFMFREQPCTTIDLNFLEQKVRIQNWTDDLFHRAFGTILQPTWEDFEWFLQDRCFPPTRGMLKEELRSLGLDSYDPLQIVEKTQGRTADDDLWMDIRYKDPEGESQPCSGLT